MSACWSVLLDGLLSPARPAGRQWGVCMTHAACVFTRRTWRKRLHAIWIPAHLGLFNDVFGYCLSAEQAPAANTTRTGTFEQALRSEHGLRCASLSLGRVRVKQQYVQYR